jgi:anaerobic ribonucleoside-triphosphate reductase
MILKVEKRNGKYVDFDIQKIENAIYKALTFVKEGGKDEASELSEKVLEILLRRFSKEEVPHVEEIQNIVEEVLISEGLTETARSYILYREKRREIREAASGFDESTELIEKYIDEIDWQVKENANMTYSLQGLNQYATSYISKKYWLNKIYPEKIREAAKNQDFHIHDLNLLATYCSGWDLQDLLVRGFGGVSSKVESKPPKHFRPALGQVVNFFYTLQGEGAGAQAMSNFDTLLAPFIRKDNLDYKQVKQSIQEFVFNCMVPTRVGFQTPFLNVSLDVRVPEFLKNQPIIIGGEPQNETYGEFQEEMDIFNEAFYEVLMQGDARGRVFTFPIPTISIAKDFDWENKALDKMWEATAKYGINYFSNFVQSDMNPEDFRSMCPLSGSEKILIKSSRGRGLEYSSIRTIYEGSSKQKSYWIYSDGRFIEGKFNKFNNQEMIRIVLANNHKIDMSTEHLNFIMEENSSKEKVVKGSELTKEMYLPYSLKSYKGSGGNRDLGYFVGAYAGDGSLDRDNSVVFSLNRGQKRTVAIKLQRIAEKYFGSHSTVSERGELLTLKIHSSGLVGICKDFVAGKKREKHYKARVFGMSEDFRQGLIDGHAATDGGNRNRIYTSSLKMVETINMLVATLGKTTSIYKDDREGRLGSEPNYAVLIYSLNRRKLENIWFKKEDKLWVKIKSIKKIRKAAAYCFEVKSGKPLFTVATTGILTHNCRLRLDNQELIKRGGGLFGSQPLTGSVGVVTINLPRIGYLSKTKEDFYKRLTEMMDLAKESLELKRKVLDNFIEKGLYPYTKHYLSSVKKMRGSYFGNHFSTIGLIGMNEALLNFMSKNIATKEGRDFALEVLKFMRDRLVHYQEETGNLYNLEATPGEGASFRQARTDRDKYPDIITAGTKDAPYYTNSVHLPVNYTDDPFEALDLQDELQQAFTGGTVIHLFLGERVSTPQAAKNIVRRVFDNYHLPYITLSPTFSICKNCGYIKGESSYCPNCKIKAPKKTIKNLKDYRSE